MGDIYDLMAEEARQSYFNLENVITSLDSKAFGAITADALLFTVFTFLLGQPLSYKPLFYIAPSLIIVSFCLLLMSVWPRSYHMQTSEEVIKKYGTMDPKLALAQLAANYADLESNLLKKYNNKFRWYFAGLVLMVLSMAIELAAFGYIIFDPLSQMHYYILSYILMGLVTL